jgi:hypothetical protein
MSIEDPDADRFEQLRPAAPDEDVADQHRTVHFDDDPEG